MRILLSIEISMMQKRKKKKTDTINLVTMVFNDGRKIATEGEPSSQVERFRLK